MDKHKLKKLCEEMNLYNQIIPYGSDEGLLYIKSDIIISSILATRNKEFKVFYRVFLQNKNDRDELLKILALWATEVAMNGYAFTDSV